MSATWSDRLRQVSRASLAAPVLAAALWPGAAVAAETVADSAIVGVTDADASDHTHYWGWIAGYAALAGLLALGVGLAQQRRIAMESDYRRRLEREVRRRTRELDERNEDLRRANDRLLEASLTDPLTGLRNRRFLFEEVTRHVDLIRRWHEDRDDVDEAFNIVFLMIDLDHFKPVNDRCGHAAGDAMLLLVRDVLLRVCRSSDFVVRWGGDEFIVISRNARPGQVESLAERLRAEIAREVFSLDDSQVVRTTCSIGFTCYPFVPGQPEAMGWEQVLGLADSALYLAKQRRDAWVGFLGTAASSRYPRLFHAIRGNPVAVAGDEALEIRTSTALQVDAVSPSA